MAVIMIVGAVVLTWIGYIIASRGHGELVKWIFAFALLAAIYLVVSAVLVMTTHKPYGLALVDVGGYFGTMAITLVAIAVMNLVTHKTVPRLFGPKCPRCGKRSRGTRYTNYSYGNARWSVPSWECSYCLYTE